jgi:hypothetical protein
MRASLKYFWVFGASSGAVNGTLTVPSVLAQPSITAPSSLTGVSNGTVTLPQPTTLPVVATPILSSGQIGIVTQPAVSTQPIISAAAITGQQQGSVASPSVSSQPVVTAAQLVGSSLLNGTLATPQSTLQAVVQAVNLSAATVGTILLRFTGLHSTSQLTLRRLDNNDLVYSGTPIDGQIEYTTDTSLLVSLVTGSGLSTEEHDKLLAVPTAASNAATVWANTTGAAVVTQLAEAWGRLGLDVTAPMTTTQSAITFGSVTMAMTGDATSTTVTRQ